MVLCRSPELSATIAYTVTEENEDGEKEEAILERWVGDFPAPYNEEWLALLREMDALETLAAKLYKALDNLEAVIQHDESAIASWLPLEYDLQMTYGNEQVKFSEYLTELRAKVREDSIQKIQKKGC